MPLFKNEALARLRDGQLALGFGVTQLRTVAAAQIAKQAGFHWLAIDMEHGSLSLSEVSQLCLTAATVGIAPIVRIGLGALDEGSRALDNGAQGLIVPQVNTLADAKRAVEALRYPPLGARGWNGGGPQFGFAPPALLEAQEFLNRENILILLVETPAAVENAESIASCPGVDALFVGASDLSCTLGCPGEYGHSQMLTAFGKVAGACRANHKHVGVGGVYDEIHAKTYIDLGARLVAGGADLGFLMSAASSRAKFLTGLYTPCGVPRGAREGLS